MKCSRNLNSFYNRQVPDKSILYKYYINRDRKQPLLIHTERCMILYVVHFSEVDYSNIKKGMYLGIIIQKAKVYS